MQRWHADDEPDRPWVRRRYRDERREQKLRREQQAADPDHVIDLTDDASEAREVDGRDFAILSRFRSRR